MGKSTLLSAVFGDDYTKRGIRHSGRWIDEYTCTDVPLRVFETTGLEIDSEKVIKKNQKEMESFLASNSSMLHAIWLCINGNYYRVSPYVFDFTKELYLTKVPLIIVLTQCVADEEETNEFEKGLKSVFASMGIDDVHIVQVLAKSLRFHGMPQPIPPFGLDTLVNLTLDIIPRNIKQSFLHAQKII